MRIGNTITREELNENEAFILNISNGTAHLEAVGTEEEAKRELYSTVETSSSDIIEQNNALYSVHQMGEPAYELGDRYYDDDNGDYYVILDRDDVENRSTRHNGDSIIHSRLIEGDEDE
jgi:hypothetical protein